MTDEELIKRVDAWIESRELAGELASLADLWTDVSGRYGPSSAPARGCLLALVREAWGDEHIHPKRTSGFNPRWTVQTPKGSCSCGAGHYYGDAEDEALIAALEAAPK